MMGGGGGQRAAGAFIMARGTDASSRLLRNRLSQVRSPPWRKDIGRGALLHRGRRYKPSGRRPVCCLVWSFVEASLLHGRRSYTKSSLVRLHGTHPGLAAVFATSGSRGRAVSWLLSGQGKGCPSRGGPNVSSGRAP